MAKRKIYKVETLVKNIVNYYNNCTESDIKAGNFYTDAKLFAESLAKKHTKFTPLQICGVIAVLSPGVSWELNKKDTKKLLNNESFGFSTYFANVLKAKEISKFNTMESIFTHIYGKAANKTANFFLNITGNFSAVTIDRHAYKIAMNKTNSGSVALTTNQYKQIETAYIVAANKLNLQPAILQAITWNCFKRLNDRGKYINLDGTEITSDCPF